MHFSTKAFPIIVFRISSGFLFVSGCFPYYSTVNLSLKININLKNDNSLELIKKKRFEPNNNHVTYHTHYICKQE